jgi:gliding motility-associated-like protein
MYPKLYFMLISNKQFVIKFLLIVCIGTTFNTTAQSLFPTNGGMLGISSAPPGWTITSGTPDVVSFDGLIPYGFGGYDCAVPLPPNGHEHWHQGVDGGIIPERSETTITGLTPGETYTFCYYAGNFHGGTDFWGGELVTRNETVNLLIDGEIASSVVFEGDSCYWKLGICTFEASGTSAVLSQNAIPTDNTFAWWHISIDADAFAICDGDCINLTLTSSATEVCFGEKITLFANSEIGGIVSWDGGITNGVSFIPPIGETTYRVTSDNEDDCPDSITIIVHDLPEVLALASQDEINLGDEIILTGEGAKTYVWNPPIDDQVPFTPDGVGSINFTVKGTDENGCMNSASVQIIIINNLLFYIPNVFTPDGNNFNETFQPVFTSGFDPYDFYLTIFSRWGELVFESYDASGGWNGTYGTNGLVQDGVFVWKIEFGDINSDKKYTYTGHVTVLK